MLFTEKGEGFEKKIMISFLDKFQMPERLSNTSTGAANNSKHYVSILTPCSSQPFKHFYISAHLILITVV